MSDEKVYRRLATIVAIDVAGYSARTEADETNAAAEVARLRLLVTDLAQRQGGRVFNTAGDGFMLEFSSSLAAIEAAYELANICEPKVRIGVHLGDVVVQSNGDLLGHGVNVAARLMARSDPGSALVSMDVRRTIRGVWLERFVPRGRLKLDKMSEFIDAFSLCAAAPSLGLEVQPQQTGSGAVGEAQDVTQQGLQRSPLRARTAQETLRNIPTNRYVDVSSINRLAGRELEFRQIVNLLNDAAKRGSGRLILVGGGSGVGKSMLIETIAQQAAQMGFVVAKSICEPFHEGMSFFPIRELMRQLSTANDLRADIREMYGDRTVQQSMAEVAELVDVDPVARRDALLGTFANIVFGRAKILPGKPLLLVIDDLERIDAGTTDSLLCLQARLDDGPVVILGGYRTSAIETETVPHALAPLISVASRSGNKAEFVRISPISQTDLKEVVRSILGGECSFPSRVWHELWKKTEGNPLFLREILRALQNSKSATEPHVALVETKWIFQGNLAEWQTPLSLENTIKARLDRMDVAVRAELERAAVIGKRFAFEVMCKVSQSEENDLLSRLEECIQLALILETRETPDTFEFTHGLIREVLYKSMTSIRRKRLHSIVATALQDLKGVVSEDWEALIGEHLYLAGQYDLATPILCNAAEQLLKVSAAAQASSLLEKSLDAAVRSKCSAEKSLEIKLTLIRALILANEYTRAHDFAVQIREEKSAGAVHRGKALSCLGEIEWALGHFDRALAAYCEAESISLAESNEELELESVAGLAEAYDRAAEQVVGVNHERASEYKLVAEGYLTRQLQLAARTTNSVAKSRALRNEAKRLRRAGNIDLAICRYEESIALLDPRIASHSVLISYAKTLRIADRHTEAAAAVNRVLEWGKQSGARRSLGIAYHHRAILRFQEFGPQDGVFEDISHALTIHREIGYGRGLWEGKILLGEWFASRGEWATALSTFRDAIGPNTDLDDNAVVATVASQLEATDESLRSKTLARYWSKSRL